MIICRSDKREKNLIGERLKPNRSYRYIDLSDHRVVTSWVRYNVDWCLSTLTPITI